MPIVRQTKNGGGASAPSPFVRRCRKLLWPLANAVVFAGALGLFQPLHFGDNPVVAVVVAWALIGTLHVVIERDIAVTVTVATFAALPTTIALAVWALNQATPRFGSPC